MPNLLLWNSCGDALEKSLAEAGVRLSVTREAEGTLALLPEAEGLILSAANISDALIDSLRTNAPRLRWLHLTNAGYDNVAGRPLPRDLVLTYTPGAGATTVAEHGMALMLALARRIPDALAEQQRGRWNYGLGDRLLSLQGRTILILGFGHIGRALARLARSFRMKVIAVSRSGRPNDLADISCGLAEAEAHIPSADFVVVAAPLTDETAGFFDAERLALIGPQAFLVNLSRGAIVDTEALLSRLKAHGMAGAAIDVAEPEPLPGDHPLWTAPNLIVTPHTAAAGPNAHDCAHVVALTTENARRFARGESLFYVVDRGVQQAA